MPRPACALAALCALPFAAPAQRPPEAFQLGVGLQQRGLHQEAVRQFQAFVEGHREHALLAEAQYRLGVSLLAIDARKEAITALEEALRRGGSGFELGFECRYRLAVARKESGDGARAGAELGRLAAELPPEHYLQAGAHYAHGECLRDGGDDEGALRAFSAAAARAEGDAAQFRFPAHYQAGFAALRLGRPAAAKESFAAAVEVAPDAAAAHECRYLAGDAALREGDAGAARRWLEEAVRGGGEFADDAALALGFTAAAAGDDDAALAAFRRFLGEHGQSPLLPRARLEVGRLLYGRQDAASAEQMLQPLAEAADESIRQQAQELLGLCALARGRGASAVGPLRQALAAAGEADRPRLSFALGEALADAGEYEEAVAAYDQAAAGAQGEGLRGDALYGACFALHQLGRYEESNARAARLRSELPKHPLLPLAVFATAENLFAEQRYEAAAKDYARVPAGSESGAKAAFKLAWCSYLQGDKAGAAQRFGRIAAGGGAHAEEALAMQALAALEAGDADAALASADAYRARHPEGAFLDRTERVAARVLRQRGDLAAAAGRLQRAAQNAEDGGADRLEQAEVQFQRGDFAAAAAIYETLALRDDAVGARALEGLAWCAFELGDDAACARHLERGLRHAEAGGLRPGLLELASALHHRQQDWRAAIDDAEAFLREFQGHEKAGAMRYALGVAQARSGDDAAARATLAALVQSGGCERMDRVHYELGWACRRGGDEPAALQAFAAVVECSEDEDLAGEARLHLGTALLEGGEVDRARAQLEAVRGSYRARALYRLGFADLEAAEAADGAPERLATAERALAEVAALEDEPLAPEALFLVGECRRRCGDHGGAAERLRALLARAPEHDRAPMARLLLAEACVALGEGDEATEQGRRFLSTSPEDRVLAARGHLALGRGRQLRGEHERAEAAFAEVTGLSEGQLAAEAQFRIGESRAARGDLQGAVDAYVKLPILYAHAQWVAKGLLQAGLACERLKQPEKARRFYSELVQRFPDAPESAEARTRLSQK